MARPPPPPPPPHLAPPPPKTLNNRNRGIVFLEKANFQHTTTKVKGEIEIRQQIQHILQLKHHHRNATNTVYLQILPLN